MRAFLTNLAIRLAMRHPAPSQIPLSGMDRLRKRKYATVYLESEGGTPSFLVTDVDPDGFRGLWFPGDYADPTTYKVLNGELDRYQLRLTYYLRELEIVYRSPAGYLIARALFFPSHQLHRERLANWVFNRKRLPRQDRMKILEYIFEQTVAQSEFQTSFADLPVRLYGRRFYSRTDREDLLSYYKIILKSLTESGDLKENGISYSLAPKAIVTLDAFSIDEERHDDNRKIQNRIVLLTSALAFLALGQMAVNIWSELHPDPKNPSLLQPNRPASHISSPTFEAPHGETPRGSGSRAG